MADAQKLLEHLAPIVGDKHVLIGDAINEDYARDEALSAQPVMPAAVLLPGSTEEVAEVLRVADAEGIPVTARGAGTGLAGACIPCEDGIVISFERMNRILEIDEENFVAIVEPGVQLDELDKELAPLGLVYPVYPGEYSASLGGNVGTNAGGMRAVKYGVTRNNVLGLEAVLASGDVIQSGGKLVKTSSGYDLTQLLIGSEGSLGLVTKAYLRLYPRVQHATTLLAPFANLEDAMQAVPKLIGSGLGPLMIEYIDIFTMGALTEHLGLELGVPKEIRSTALAYLVVVLENGQEDRLGEDSEAAGEILAELGAVDIYLLEGRTGEQLIEAREKAFWVAKAGGSDDIIDIVVPRASIAGFMERVAQTAKEFETMIPGCGHAGDGNVHMSVFQKDPGVRSQVLRSLFKAAMEFGGAISGEHGLGREKRKYFLELEDPAKIALLSRIKTAFDPNGILNPGVAFSPEDAKARSQDPGSA